MQAVPGQALFEATYYSDEGPFVIVPSTAAALLILPPALLFGVCVSVTGGIIGLPALPFIENKKYLNSFVLMPGFYRCNIWCQCLLVPIKTLTKRTYCRTLIKIHVEVTYANFISH